MPLIIIIPSRRTGISTYIRTYICITQCYTFMNICSYCFMIVVVVLLNYDEYIICNQRIHCPSYLKVSPHSATNEHCTVTVTYTKIRRGSVRQFVLLRCSLALSLFCSLQPTERPTDRPSHSPTYVRRYISLTFWYPKRKTRVNKTLGLYIYLTDKQIDGWMDGNSNEHPQGKPRKSRSRYIHTYKHMYVMMANS